MWTYSKVEKDLNLTISHPTPSHNHTNHYVHQQKKKPLREEKKKRSKGLAIIGLTHLPLHLLHLLITNHLLGYSDTLDIVKYNLV